MEATGRAEAHLWLATDAPDLVFFVYLEEVDGGGQSTYITEGALRASHRRLGRAPYANLGAPFHSHYQSDLASIPPKLPVELVFSLLSISHRFPKGSRVRITVAFAGADNFETPVIDPAPKVTVLRGGSYPSFVQLPIISSR